MVGPSYVKGVSPIPSIYPLADLLSGFAEAGVIVVADRSPLGNSPLRSTVQNRLISLKPER